ncbi:hypothetical protein [Azospirillum canadense]|uniref:hypothetical protein n=1 Tax=Azospirillum canadense TaxID=403962 RepID=UPI00222679EF|nr:hypothetical protein [Azospirillum canadense]MCW2242239.1 hypothetical protein [Azospirillum canadense]
MAHIFEGEPDARQAGDIKPSRFRPQYRQLSDEEKTLHDAIKGKAAELEALFEKARALRFAPRTAAIEANVAASEAAVARNDQAGISDWQAPPPALDWARLDEEFPVGNAPSYFDDGMKALEMSVMWTVKGLTA